MNDFEVKTNECVNKTFRIPLDLLQQLETVAQKSNVSVNKLVVQCCEYALKNLKQTGEIN